MYSEDYERGRAQQGNAEDVYSKPVRAGKRTYFFDVKATKGNNDYYLTITESKRRQEQDGTFSYDKHKIFLYNSSAAASAARSRSSRGLPSPSPTSISTSSSIRNRQPSCRFF